MGGVFEGEGKRGPPLNKEAGAVCKRLYTTRPPCKCPNVSAMREVLVQTGVIEGKSRPPLHAI
eukprot:9384481-Pyramimonas_sp.AAC.1